MKSRSVKLNPLNIETTAGTQSRHSINQTIIEEYADGLRRGDLYPQIVVFAEKGSERYILADGFHRLPAHIAVFKDKSIACDIREGTVQDAKLYAAGANAEHGVRRTPMDIRHSVRMLLLDGKWTSWSDQTIGDAARVHRHTVTKVREEMTLAGELGNGAGKKTRTFERNGKIITSVAGRKKKDKKKDDARPMKTQEEYDREEILTALATFRTAVCSGAAAIDKYNLSGYGEEVRIAHQWLEELLDELGRRAAKAKSGDDEAFLKVSDG